MPPYRPKSPKTRILFLLAMVTIMTFFGLLPFLYQLPRRSQKSLRNYSNIQKAKAAAIGRSSLPQELNVNLVDVKSSWNKNNDNEDDDDDATTPLYWHIPESGDATLLAMYSNKKCFGLVLAGDCPVENCLEQETLQIDKKSNTPLLSTTTRQNLHHASSLNLVSSSMVHIITTPIPHDAASILFTPTHRGKMFALFRHPVERLVSLFYSLSKTTTATTSTTGTTSGDNNGNYNVLLSSMTLDEYAKSSMMEQHSNWMVRSLSGKLETPDEPITKQDLDVSIEILRRKCLVGLTTELEESFTRFNAYIQTFLDFSNNDEIAQSKDCQESILQGNNASRSYPLLERDGETWKLMEQKNGADMILYREVEKIFAEQSSLIPKIEGSGGR